MSHRRDIRVITIWPLQRAPYSGHVWPALGRAQSQRGLCGPHQCVNLFVDLVPPPPLYKLRPCPSYSRRRDRNNFVRNLITYKM